MATTTTTLSAAVSATDTVITIGSATSIAVGRYLLVDQEMMRVGQGWVSGTNIPVLRGQDGTVTIAHKITANVTHGTAADFAVPTPVTTVTYPPSGRARQLISITAATSTLVLPPGGADLDVVLNGTAAITLTIPVPTKDMDGSRLTIMSNGVAQHLLTFTGGLSGAGANYDVITINSTAPAAFGFVACNALWMSICGAAVSGTTTNIAGAIA